MISFRKAAYIINILSVICIVCVFIVSVVSIVERYKKLLEMGYGVEKEYNSVLDKYRRVAVFILKNNLPKNINYFDLVSSATYNLFPIVQFEAGKPEDAPVDKKSNLVNIIGCHDNRCIKVLINKSNLLAGISKNKLWHHGEIKTLPVKKVMLLRLSTDEFFNSHKNILFIILICFLSFYLPQAIFFLMKYFRLRKENDGLLVLLDKSEQELTIRIQELDKLYDISPSFYEFISEYFAYYASELISRDINLVNVKLVDVLQKIERFFACQVVKKNLKITFNDISDVTFIRSDSEILFIVLLNLIFKSISRAKISSEIVIKFFQEGGMVKIKVCDIGFEYKPKVNNKIKIHMLPDVFLENLCRKIKVTGVSESRSSSTNSIVIEIMNIKE